MALVRLLLLPLLLLLNNSNTFLELVVLSLGFMNLLSDNLFIKHKHLEILADFAELVKKSLDVPTLPAQKSRDVKEVKQALVSSQG